ncbi:hypothetical protein SELR_pSRC300750 (plasmid) [Selenomonas ruminantium subsp. lactilytica TAM6421]|uniref:Uncharacterized protein n=1 Tax=Selenomonas ruminantium subsp. lactilytica (strain NBRC 103574 / TAM6421) TaxID=927704 RepID=I0GWL1_SELRL|nr:hypothetical protein [Selenomonas ruminantium]BAL85148.1 hypothetical protein SELR_pSRC300750 [Selenomonas ruminantium subsp. lactilytica TAM6421]
MIDDDNEFLRRYDAGEQFDEEEIEELVYAYGEEKHVGEPQRWSTPVQSVFSMGDRLFAVDWSRGNTEMQENEFYEQPYEVKKVKKMVEVTEYVKLEDK